MSTRVYQFGCRPPTEGAAIVIAQLRAAHDYRNDLVVIERGRRWALRRFYDTPEVREAVAVLTAATTSSRKAARAALVEARKAAREAAATEPSEVEREEVPIGPVRSRLAFVGAMDHRLRIDARALTSCHWGTYLEIEAERRAAREAPLYDADMIEPHDPAFRRWTARAASTAPVGYLPLWPEGQLGVQLQASAARVDTAKAQSCTDTRVRLQRGGAKDGDRRFGKISLRIDSDGRAPIWATWPVKIHREIPDAAVWKWVRVSVRHEGRREQWSCEITVQDPTPPVRTLDHALTGAIFVEWCWEAVLDDTKAREETGALRVARWTDTRGGSGDVVLPSYVAGNAGIRKGDGIRAVRDTLQGDVRPKLSRMIRESKGLRPPWLGDAAVIMAARTDKGWAHPSHWLLHGLHRRWHEETPTAVPLALACLDEWVRRDRHLWDYEAPQRRQAIRQRRDIYRNLAARWSREYRTVVLSDQDLSREARFGDESDRRFTAGCSELRQCLRNTFGPDAIDGAWAKPQEDEETSWCERTRDAWIAGGSRDEAKFAKRKASTANAWAKKKTEAKERREASSPAREPVGNAAE